MSTALIVYASLTGNTEETANLLSKALISLGVETTVRECTQVSASDFLEYDMCVVATYTWGREGELPDEIDEFYEELENIDLSGKTFGVLGTGEKIYDYYCKSVADFHEQFLKTGAIAGSSPLKIESFPDKQAENEIFSFAENLIKNTDIQSKK